MKNPRPFKWFFFAYPPEMVYSVRGDMQPPFLNHKVKIP
jgi:hypothetical protein